MAAAEIMSDNGISQSANAKATCMNARCHEAEVKGSLANV